jgi:ribosomal protein L37AE/L43A
LICINADRRFGDATVTTPKNPTLEAEKKKQRRVAMTTTCVKCGEALIAPDWSEFVSEQLVLNLWTCTKCGDRFQTKTYMPPDAEPKMNQKDWEEMFPPLLVA